MGRVGRARSGTSTSVSAMTVSGYGRRHRRLDGDRRHTAQRTAADLATATSGSDLNDTDSVFVVSSLTDMTPPEVTITAPPAGTTVSGDGTVVPVPVAAEVRDDFLGIAAIDYSFDGSVRAREEFTTPQRSWHASA